MRNNLNDKPLAWLKTAVKTPPCSFEGRQEIGRLLRDLQQGKKIVFPDSRPMPSIGPRCHELRVWDSVVRIFWRVIYRVDSDAIVVVQIFAKKSAATPHQIIDTCKQRLSIYDAVEKQQ